MLVSDPVTDVVAAVEKARADDRLITSPATLLADTTALLDAMTLLGSLVVDRLTEAAQVNATHVEYGRGMRAWLVEDEMLAAGEASRFVQLATHLPVYPATRDALRTARISLAHAHAIVKALRSLPVAYRATIEPHLLELAVTCTPEEIAGFVDALLEALGLDKTSDVRREKRYAERGFNIGQSFDGHRSACGSLTDEVGERLTKALELAAQPAGPEDDRTVLQRWHDALGVIADAYLTQHGNPSFTGAPRTVMVTIDLETLENQLRDAWLTLPSGAQISAATARRLACDAELIPVVLGRKGEVLDVGQADHEFTAAMRRAAWIRDQGRCAFPGCRNTPGELHHIMFKRHGGPGVLDNAAWLCCYHHWLAHEGHWTLQRTPDGHYLWTGTHGQQRIRYLGRHP